MAHKLVVSFIVCFAFQCSPPSPVLPPAKPSKNTLQELLGVNAYWGWGQNQYAFLSPPELGPALYTPIVSHARNYHDITWDISAPNIDPQFAKMANNQGTNAKEWLNWDREYAEWRKHGLDLQVSIQLANFEDNAWQNSGVSIEANAFQYGVAFAKHFGKKHGNGLVHLVEIGNEPWKYEAAIYRQILSGMTKGIKSIDTTMQVLPCALQARYPDYEQSDWRKNYMPVRIPEAILPQLHGINIHCYSTRQTIFGERTGVHPEHPESTFWEMLDAIKWRNKYMPEGKIYLSEWGWDHPGGGEDCTHGDCVSADAAAVYAVRGALIAHSLGIERATWFYFANEEKASDRFTRSGLTSSKLTGFQKKSTYFAFQDMVEELWDKHFLSRVIKDDVYLMYYGKLSGEKTHLIAWLSVDYEKERKEKISIEAPIAPKENIYFPKKLFGNKKASMDYANGQLMLEIGAHPVLVKL